MQLISPVVSSTSSSMMCDASRRALSTMEHTHLRRGRSTHCVDLIVREITALRKRFSLVSLRLFAHFHLKKQEEEEVVVIAGIPSYSPSLRVCVCVCSAHFLLPRLFRNHLHLAPYSRLLSLSFLFSSCSLPSLFFALSFYQYCRVTSLENVNTEHGPRLRHCRSACCIDDERMD